jgi:hypothetical protein
MLLTGPGRAVWIPLGEVLATTFGGALIAYATLSGAVDAQALTCVGVFELALALLAANAFVRIEAHDDRVHVRRLRRSFDVPRTVEVGYVTRGGSRSAALVVYLTDGETRRDLFHAVPLGLLRAERLTARLRKALDLFPTAAAAAAAEADARMLREATGRARAQHRMPQHRRAVGVLLGLMLLCTVLMAIFALTR